MLVRSVLMCGHPELFSRVAVTGVGSGHRWICFFEGLLAWFGLDLFFGGEPGGVYFVAGRGFVSAVMTG